MTTSRFFSKQNDTLRANFRQFGLLSALAVVNPVDPFEAGSTIRVRQLSVFVAFCTSAHQHRVSRKASKRRIATPTKPHIRHTWHGRSQESVVCHNPRTCRQSPQNAEASQDKKMRESKHPQQGGSGMQPARTSFRSVGRIFSLRPRSHSRGRRAVLSPSHEIAVGSDLLIKILWHTYSHPYLTAAECISHSLHTGWLPKAQTEGPFHVKHGWPRRGLRGHHGGMLYRLLPEVPINNLTDRT